MTARIIAALFVAACIGVGVSHADDPAVGGDARAQLESLQAAAHQFEAEGKVDDAIAAMEKAEQFAIDAKLDDALPDILIFLTTRRIRADRLEAARRTALRMHELDKASYGEGYWRTRAWTVGVTYIDALSALNDAPRKNVLHADAELARVDALIGANRNDEAIKIAQEASEVFRQHLGEASSSYADAGGKLGKALHAAGRSAQAEPLLRKAIQQYADIYGEGHPSVVDFAVALCQAIGLRAAKAEEDGNLDKALALRQEAVDVLRPKVQQWDGSLDRPCYELVRLKRKLKPIEPQKVETLFVDEFNENTLKRYDADAKVAWRDGSLHLNGGAFSRDAPADMVGEVLIDLELSEGLEGDYAFCRWGFGMGTDDFAWVGVYRIKSDDGFTEELMIGQLVKDEKGARDSFIRRWPLKIGSGGGPWRIRLDHRLMQVEHDGDVYYAVFGSIANQPITSFVATANQMEAALQRLEVRGRPQRQYSQDERHLHIAAKAYDDAESRAVKQGDYLEALALRLTSHKYRTALYGEQDPRVAASWNALGFFHQAQRKYDQALDLFEESLKIYRRELGELHPDTVKLWNNVAYAQQHLGNNAIAIPIYERAVRINETIFGEMHSDTATTLSNLGTAYFIQGEHAVAMEYVERALKIRRQLYGDEAPETAGSYSILADGYIQLGDAERALPLAEKCLKILSSARGETHPDTVDAMHLQARALLGMGELIIAQTNADTVFQLKKQRYGVDDPRTISAGQLLRRILEQAANRAVESSDFALAAEAAGRKVALLVELCGADNWSVAAARLDQTEYQSVAELAEVKRARYIQATGLVDESERLSKDGRAAEALRTQSQAVDLLAEALGEQSPRCAWETSTLGSRFAALRKLDEALEAAQRFVDIYRKVLGPDHPSLITGLTSLADLHRHGGRLDVADETLAEAKRVLDRAHDVKTDQIEEMVRRWREAVDALAGQCEQAGRWDQAEKLRRQSLELAEKTYGEEDWRSRNARLALARTRQIRSLDSVALADLFEARVQGEIEKRDSTDVFGPAAVKLRRELLEKVTRHVGADSPDAISAEYDLAYVLLKARQLEEAVQRFQRVAAWRIKALGEAHPQTAQTYLNLSNAHAYAGDLALALPACRKALEIQRRAGVTETNDYASTLNTLSGIYFRMGDDRKAVQFQEETGRLLARILGRHSLRYAISRSNLATMYRNAGDPRAGETMTEAIELVRKAYGEDHPEFAMMQEKAGAAFEATGELDKAEQMYRAALETRQRTLGENHRLTLDSMASLANVLVRQGNADESVATLRTVVAKVEQQFGAEHPDYASHCSKLALALVQVKDIDEAIEQQQAAVDSLARRFDATSAVQSERQQLILSADYLWKLHVLLRMSAHREQDTAQTYQRLLAWKGAVLSRQLARRSVADNKELAPVVEELRQVTRAIAALQSAADDAETRVARQKQRTRLLERKETLEAQLATKAAEHRRDSDPAAALADLRKQLPSDGALVDFFVYRGASSTDKDDGMRIAAFVVQPTGPVKRIELGPAAEIESAIDDWRRDIVRGAGGVRGDRRFRPQGPTANVLPQKLLREKVWDPIEQHLEDAKIVLISPDGVLAQLPFAALPGRKEGSYLLEERLLVHIPAPQMLSMQRGGDRERAAAGDTLLLVGDVDFGASIENRNSLASSLAVAHSRGGLTQFSRLPATAVEVKAIADLFAETVDDADAKTLVGAAATEDALRTSVAGRRYVHFATHGYFRDEAASPRGVDDQPTAEGVLPGLQSGLVLAGANRGTRFSLSQLAADDDGLLTAVEVAELDLHNTDLAVLSACETGLGRVAGGEGLLGLQRAFHLAGAQTVVSTLWQVDDEATRALMVEFYRNLWQRRLGRLESLRRAQIALLQGKLHRPAGLADAEDGGRLPPRFWAAFVLSGQWQ